jgi:hypothetical protein
MPSACSKSMLVPTPSFVESSCAEVVVLDKSSESEVKPVVQCRVDRDCRLPGTDRRHADAQRQTDDGAFERTHGDSLYDATMMNSPARLPRTGM